MAGHLLAVAVKRVVFGNEGSGNGVNETRPVADGVHEPPFAAKHPIKRLTLPTPGTKLIKTVQLFSGHSFDPSPDFSL